MNVKRFSARTSRDALVLVRQALGDDAVVLSTKPSGDGVEVLAMAPEGMQQIERMSAPAQPGERKPQTPRVEPRLETTTGVEDAQRLGMSTLSFQDYVRERMLKRRQAALQAARQEVTAAAAAPGTPAERPAGAAVREPAALLEAIVMPPPGAAERHAEPLWGDGPAAADSGAAQTRRDQQDMLNELRSVKGLIEERFGALAFMEKLQRQPVQARLTQRLLDSGFSPALIRKLCEGLPADATDDAAWVAGVLERNLLTGETDGALENQGGVHALVGSTGVGKTTTTAKLAAAFAASHGASHLGLITLDAYRVGAHEQLRAYGRILGVPVHTAHDRSSLEDLLDLLSAKKMVLIDTAGMAQRDARTRELLDMLAHRSIKRLLVVNAAAQGETIDDVMISYRAATCEGIVLSKTDEAVKLGPALDALIRHKLKVVGVANGQRVPEDWHRLSAHALVHRALRASAVSSAFRMDASEVSLVFANASRPAAARADSGVLAG